MKNPKEFRNSCGNGNGSCGDLFVLPFCGNGKRTRKSRRALRTGTRTTIKAVAAR